MPADLAAIPRSAAKSCVRRAGNGGRTERVTRIRSRARRPRRSRAASTCIRAMNVHIDEPRDVTVAKVIDRHADARSMGAFRSDSGRARCRSTRRGGCDRADDVGAGQGDQRGARRFARGDARADATASSPTSTTRYALLGRGGGSRRVVSTDRIQQDVAGGGDAAATR